MLFEHLLIWFEIQILFSTSDCVLLYGGEAGSWRLQLTTTYIRHLRRNSSSLLCLLPLGPHPHPISCLKSLQEQS